VTVTNEAKNYGEQAGLFIFSDSQNWVKLVLEGMEDGKVYAVFAYQVSGKPKVINKIEILSQPSTLRLEFGLNQPVVAILSKGDLLRLIDKCDLPILPSDLKNYQLALSAHGGSKEKIQMAVFTDFHFLKLAEDRIPFGIHKG